MCVLLTCTQCVACWLQAVAARYEEVAELRQELEVAEALSVVAVHKCGREMEAGRRVQMCGRGGRGEQGTEEEEALSVVAVQKCMRGGGNREEECRSVERERRELRAGRGDAGLVPECSGSAEVREGGEGTGMD